MLPPPPSPPSPPVFSSRCTPVSSKREQRWRKTKQLGEGARNNFPSRFLFRPFIATNLTPSPPTRTQPPPTASCCYTIPNRGRNPFCRLPTMTPSDAGRSDRGLLLRFPRYRPVTNFFFRFANSSDRRRNPTFPNPSFSRLSLVEELKRN